MPFSRFADTFEPEELAILQRVFNRIVAEHGIVPKSPEGEALAAEIVRLRVIGLQEQSLLRRLRRYPN
jgi:hypothetical protein